MPKVTIKELQEKIKSKDETIALLIKDNNRLHKEIDNIKSDKEVVTKVEYDALASQIELIELRAAQYKKLYDKECKKEKVVKVKNARGAGRKPIDPTIRYKVRELNEQGTSIRKIAKELNISVGSVHKIITEQNEEVREL